MTTGTADSLSRRALLRGRPTPERTEGPSFAASCLARNGVLCRTCGDVCPEGAIRFPPLLGRIALPSLDLERCTRCGDCVTACPVAALTLDSSRAG